MPDSRPTKPPITINTIHASFATKRKSLKLKRNPYSPLANTIPKQQETQSFQAGHILLDHKRNGSRRDRTQLRQTCEIVAGDSQQVVRRGAVGTRDQIREKSWSRAGHRLRKRGPHDRPAHQAWFPARRHGCLGRDDCTWLRERHPGIPFHHADISQWNLPRKYDFISAWDSTWHLPLKHQEPVLEKICAGLNPGGVHLFTTIGLDAPGDHGDSGHMGVPLAYGTLGIPKLLELLPKFGCVCRHLEYDQYPEMHLYVIVQKN